SFLTLQSGQHLPPVRVGLGLLRLALGSGRGHISRWVLPHPVLQVPFGITDIAISPSLGSTPYIKALDCSQSFRPIEFLPLGIGHLLHAMALRVALPELLKVLGVGLSCSLGGIR